MHSLKARLAEALAAAHRLHATRTPSLVDVLDALETLHEEVGTLIDAIEEELEP